MRKLLSFFIFISILMFSCDQSVNMLLGVGQALDSESPKISITPPENGIYINKSNITIEGQCSDNVGVTRITAEASLADVTAKVTEELFFKKALTAGNWSITFNADKLDRELNLWQSGKEVTFTLTCYDAAGNNMVQHLFLYIDMDMPVVTIDVPEKRFKNTEKEEYEKNPVKFNQDYNINEYEHVNSFVNKVFSIKGYIDDNYTVRSTYINIYDSTKEKLVAVTPVIYKDGSSKELHELTTGEVKGSSRSWEFTLDSEEFCKDKGWYAIQVVTEDEAGNGKEQKQFIEKSWIYVNQAADVPKNNFTSFSPGLKLNAGNLVGGSCFDDDGMREIWIKIVPEAEANPEEPYTQWTEREDTSHIIKKYADFTDGGQLKNWNLKCPSKAGDYKIYVIPVDVNEVSPAVPYEGIYVSYFSVASEEDPVVVVDAEFRGSTIVEKREITGYFYDNIDVSKINVSMVFDKNEEEKVTLELYDFSKDEDKNAIKITKSDNSFQLTTGQTVVKNFFKWEFDTSKYPAYKELQMTFKTEDEDGNYGEDAITIYGDSERPSFVGAVTPANNSNIQESNVFKGTVSDNVDVVSVTIKTDAQAWKKDVICTLGKPEKVNGKTVRTFESGEIIPADFGGWSDREFTVTATDATGNAVSQIITLKGDKTKPVVTFVDESGVEEKSGNYVTTSKILNVHIKPASFNDGTHREIKSATYSIGTQEPIALNVNKTGDNYSTQIKVADLGNISGDVTVQVTAKDEEGNDGQGTIYFIVDNEEPSELAITSPLLKNRDEIEKLADNVADINENEISFYQNGEMLLKGTVSDNYKIDKTCLSLCKLPDLQEVVLSAELAVADDGKLAISVDGEKKDAIVDYSGIPGNFTLKLNTAILDDGDYILKTTAYDAAGNSKSWGKDGSGEYSFKVLQEADIPRITFNIEDNATVFPGTVLKGAVIDDDSVKADGVRFFLSTTVYSDDAALAELKKADSAVAKTLGGINQFTRNDWQLDEFQALGWYYLYMTAEDINGKQSSLYKLAINVTSTDSPFIKAINSSAGTDGKVENGYCRGNVKIIVSATGGQADLKYMYYRLTLSSNTGSVSEDIIPVSGTSDSFTFPADGVLGKWYKFEFNSSKVDNDQIILEVDSNKIANGKTDTINIEVMCENSINTKSVAVKDKIAIDNESPTLKIVTPTGNASVNKKIDISGSCNDRGAGVKGIYVSYQAEPTTTISAITDNMISDVPTLGKWCELEADGISWDGKFDTEIIYKGADTKSYNFTVATVDMLGNITFTQQPMTIDQDGDRPIVRFQNLAVPTDGNAIWCNSSSIYGMITDDDGENNIEVYVSEDNGASWSTNSYTNGAWRYNFAGDGEKNLAFKVVDSTGVTFESKDVIDLTTVKLDGLSKDGITKFKVKVDTDDPQIDNYYYCVQKLAANEVPGGINGNSVDFGVWSNSFSGKVFGGAENIVWLLFGGEDANGIASGELTCTTENSGVLIDNPIKITSDSSKVFYKFKVDISNVDLTLLTFKFELKDNANRTQTNNFTIDVDNTPPVVRVNSHTDDSKVYGTESNTVRGSAADSNEVIKVEYALTLENTAPAVYEELNTSSLLNWEMLFKDENVFNNKLLGLLGLGGSLGGERNLYLWVKATDEFGNVNTPESVKLVIITDGDIPLIEIDNPERKGAGEELEILGGIITVAGTTDIQTSTVKEVYVQIDPSYENEFDANWETELRNVPNAHYEIVEIPGGNGLKGIKVASSSKKNWRLNINENSELEGTVAVKAIAVSVTERCAVSEAVVFKVDRNVPLFEDLYLVQKKNGNEVKRQKYEPEMWISGEGWQIEGAIIDNEGVDPDSIKCDQPSYELSKSVKSQAGNGSNYNFVIPLNTADFGNVKLIVSAVDVSEQHYPASHTFMINYDNTLPEFSVKQLSLEKTSRTKIENSSGTYTIAGSFSEDSKNGHNQSGFERIAMYFTRTLDGTTYLIDSMLQKGDNGTDNYNDVSSFEQADGMYWKKANATVNGNEITLSGIPTNVCKGGLCKIGGIIYRIDEIHSGSIIVNGTPSAAGEIYFAMAQVIDNLIIENGKTTYYEDFANKGKIEFDDGDEMVEGVREVGTKAEWTVTINSENIFDGNVDVHFVAFDKAGNATPVNCYGKVTNNAPRIAGVAFGTDKNSNKAIEDKELIESYYNLYDTSASIDDGRLEGVSVNGMDGIVKVTNLNIPLDDVVVSQMVIKDSVGINAKVVGGNIGLQWQWKIDGFDWSDLRDFNVSSSYGNDIRTNLPMMMITMADFLKAGVGNLTDTTLSIRIWDKTVGTTAGKDSQYAEINIVVDTILQDNQAPTVTITPFYWNSESDNSLYENNRANGHIELPADLTKAITDELGADPKVSGKITIEGTAVDNVQLKELLVKIPGFKGGAEFTMATYANGSWTSAGSMDTDGWTCEVVPDETEENDHKVNWKLHWDTSEIDGTVAKDVTVTVKAKDRGKASVSGNEVVYNGTPNTSEPVNCQMDVVPYIANVDTWIGGNAGSEFARSAMGYYDIYAGEKIVINGFNLKNSTTAPTVKIGSTSVTVNSSTINSITATVGTTAVSGEMSVSVNSVESLNNTNGNPTFTDESTEVTGGVRYNSMANNRNNNRLTDDVKFHIWDMGNFVSKTNITGPMMKMDKSGNYYMIYDNNTYSGAFSLVYNKNGTTTRIDGGYNKWIHSTLAVDGQGRIFGVSTNSDRVGDTSSRFKFYTNRTSDGSFTESSYQSNDDYRRSLEQVYNDATGFYDIDRVARPKMFAQGTSGASKIYMSYFDGNHTKSPVKFRYGTANGTTVNGGIAGNTNGTSESGSSVTSRTGSAANFHVLADSTMQYQGGEYTAVGATSGGVAVVAWYDASKKQLIYSYNTTPNSPVYGGVWQTNAKVIGSAYDGWHVDLFVDSKDGIHLAFYNSGKGDLKYAYLPKYNCAASEIKVVTVDSYLSAGTNITIETRDEVVNGTTYIVPYISYYHASFASSPSCIRVAYMPESIRVNGNTVTANVADGAKNDLFTGKWEVAVVPTVNIPDEVQVCIGLPAVGHATYKQSPVIGFKSNAIGYERAYIKY